MQRNTCNEDAVRGENGESRLTAENVGAASKNVDGIVDDEPEETSVLRFTSNDGGERPSTVSA